jgi:(p)ppGpp synthase/HD superfamily hydrolase
MYEIEDYNHALSFAAKAHKSQKYGTELPYLFHVVSVAHEVIYSLNRQEKDYPKLAIQCALLHDAIEDTEYNYGDIRLEFGVDVAEGVLALTKNKDLPKYEQLKDSVLRIKQLSPEIGMVKLADRVCNLKTSPKWSVKKKLKYLEESLYIYEELKLHDFRLSSRLNTLISTYNFK